MLNATLKIAAGFFQQNPTKLRKKYTFPCFCCCWEPRTLGILAFSKRSGFWCKPGQYKWKHFPKKVIFSFKNHQNFDKECNSSSASSLFSTISISYEFMEGMGEGKGALGEGLLLWLSPCTVPVQVVWCGCAHMARTPMPPCPGHLIAPTMTWRWWRCYTASLLVHVQVMRLYWVVGRAVVGGLQPPASAQDLASGWFRTEFRGATMTRQPWQNNCLCCT